MSKRQFRSQASSGRAANPASGFGAFGSPQPFGASSVLSYITEPPDLSSVSEPSVVVAFKNLSKKDATTKAKALEELQAYILAHTVETGGVEDGALEAWIKMYPRTSIDTSRRVRQLAHGLQGQIAVSSGKRMAKQMPVAAGAWLAGLYDNDRLVARAAQEAFRQVFASPEKARNVWKVFQRPILEYIRDAVLRETVLTLSDERTVSPDDAEAKHARVLATGILVLVKLMEEVPKETVEHERVLVDEILQDKKLWNHASHKDYAVRRSVYKLLTTTISKLPEHLVDILSTLSAEIIYKSLVIDQSGSSWEYSMALSTLTAAFPTVWTDHYSGKKSAPQRLKQYLKRGSQNGPAEVWNNTTTLLRKLPASILPSELSETSDLLDSLHDGVANKDESRSNLPAAWTCYYALFDQLILNLNPPDQVTLVRQHALPIVDQYLRPSLENSRWSAGTRALSICRAALKSTSKVSSDDVAGIIEEKWFALAKSLVEQMKASAPAQSRDFDKSQKSVAASGERWALLNTDLLKDTSIRFDESISKAASSVVQGAVEVLKARNGKPYGAASVLEFSLNKLPDAVLQSEESSNLISRFFIEGLPELIPSASFPILVSTLSRYGDDPDHISTFTRAFNSTLRALLVSEDVVLKTLCLQTLIASLTPKNGTRLSVDAELEEFVRASFKQAMQGEVDRWPLLETALASETGVISSTTADDILSGLTRSLTVREEAEPALRGFDIVAKANGNVLRESIRNQSELLSNLLSLTESSDETLAAHAEITSAAIESLFSEKHGALLSDSILTIIDRELNQPGPSSISVPSLVDRAQSLHAKAGEESQKLALELIPSSERWHTALEPFLDCPPHPCLAITDALGGSLYLAAGSGLAARRCPRDATGWSAALRIAAYVTQLLKSTEIFGSLSITERSRVLQQLLLSIQLTKNQLDVPGANFIYVSGSVEAEEDVLELVGDAQTLISSWLHDEESQDLITSAQDGLCSNAKGLSASALYHARAFAYVTEEMTETYGASKRVVDSVAERLKERGRRRDDLFETTSLLVGYRTPLSRSKATDRMCNELISDLTGLDYAAEPLEALRLLVLLNSIIQHQDVVSEIPHTRLLPLVKHLLEWWDGSLPKDPRTTAEVAKALTAILPVVQTVYGRHWTYAMQFVDNVWTGTGTIAAPMERLPAIHAALRLLIALKKIHSANDDADEAWKEIDWLNSLVLALRAMPSEVSDDAHQPLRIVKALVARLIAELPASDVDESDELYGLLYSQSASVQQTAFYLLRRVVQCGQEEISVELALSKSTATLPEEVLSLILEAPTLESLEDTRWDRSMPVSLRGYLLSWLLIFDHFSTSSYKVRSDYIESLKKGSYLASLLDFTFDFLGHSRGKPVDASRFAIETYIPEAEESAEKEAQSLLINLYYLCLTYLPSLTKSWWLDCPHRQKVVSIESWTERYISPVIIAHELSTVSDWVASGQDPTDADSTLLKVRVSKNAKEVSAGYDVDEQTMQIVIRLPPVYPLRQATVEGVHRVGVDERKWRSWLVNTQGVIQFSNGSIIDGLTAWRRNVQGAMKGQSECAICYSIISGDKQLPNKRCGTCKNLFHSSCLFRWFKSSNSSSCPLCRNAFNYG